MALGKSKDVVGIDIGSSSIKLVQLKAAKKGYKLVNMGMVPIPPETIVDGTLMNTPLLVEKVEDLVAELKIKVKDVVSSVSGHSVILKKIQLPQMNDQELAEEIKFEAGKYIPHDIDEVYMDYYRYGHLTADDQMEVLLAAVKKDHLNDHIGVLKDAGMNPVVMDIDCFALQNMFEANYQLDDAEVVALVNIGASVTNINIVQGGVSLFTRDVSVGGDQYTEEIQKALNISYEESNAMKVGSDHEGESEEVIPQEVSDVIRSVSESIATEVMKSLDFFLTTAADMSISRIYLSGGCSKLQGLDKIIEDKAGYPVEHIDPFRSIEINAKTFDADFVRRMAPSAAVAVGLAMRHTNDKFE